MASEVKYKKGGCNSCAGNGCSNNRRKLNEWNQTFCELHKQKHEDCSCMIPYRLHTMPSKESIRLQVKQTYEVFSKLQYVTIKKYIKGMHYYI
jgi:hypothetical protein